MRQVSTNATARPIGRRPVSLWIVAISVLLFLDQDGDRILSAQEPESPSSPEEQAQLFVDSVEVEVINVDVYVRDKDGNPIRGLTKDDFKLEVGGRPSAITNFYAVSRRKPAVSSPLSAAIEDESVEDAADTGSDVGVDPASSQTTSSQTTSSQTTAQTEEKLPPEQQLLVVVYIDNFNLTPFNRNRVMGELRAFFRESLSLDDQIMLMSYDRSLHLRQPFTNRPDDVARAMMDLEDISAQRVHRDNERTDIFAAINDTHHDNPGDAMMRAEAYAGSVRNDTSFSIDALASVVDHLAASPGRKALVYVSDGIPMIAGEDVFTFATQIYGRESSLIELAQYDMSRRFLELARKANSNRVTFYTIDARGLTVLSQGTVDAATSGYAGQQALIDQIWTQNLQSPLQMMAEETGGHAIINANRIANDLEQIADDFSNYYSLGFTPSSAGDGRYHSIKVSLKENLRGVEVRHRSGYRDKSLEARMIDGTLSALNLDLQSNNLGASLDFGQPKARDDGHLDLPIYLSIPFENLVLLPKGADFAGQLRVWIAAKDDADEATEAHELPVEILIPGDRIGETKGKTYTYGVELTMEPGYHDVAIGVLDGVGALRAFLRKGVQIQRPSSPR